jgi:hypothetical protein
MFVDTQESFKRNLNRLIGKQCVGFTAGEAAGSVVDLEFGLRRPRKVPLNNPILTEEQRSGEPEYSFLIECVWRLDSPSSVVCGAWDENCIGGRMLVGLEGIAGQAVISAQLATPGLDLELVFSNRWSLKVFCDQVNEADQSDNYNFYCPDRIFTVGTKSQLSEESREP